MAEWHEVLTFNIPPKVIGYLRCLPSQELQILLETCTDDLVRRACLWLLDSFLPSAYAAKQIDRSRIDIGPSGDLSLVPTQVEGKYLSPYRLWVPAQPENLP